MAYFAQVGFRLLFVGFQLHRHVQPVEITENGGQLLLNAQRLEDGQTGFGNKEAAGIGLHVKPCAAHKAVDERHAGLELGRHTPDVDRNRRRIDRRSLNSGLGGGRERDRAGHAVEPQRLPELVFQNGSVKTRFGFAAERGRDRHGTSAFVHGDLHTLGGTIFSCDLSADHGREQSKELFAVHTVRFL